MQAAPRALAHWAQGCGQVLLGLAHLVLFQDLGAAQEELVLARQRREPQQGLHITRPDPGHQARLHLAQVHALDLQPRSSGLGLLIRRVGRNQAVEIGAQRAQPLAQRVHLVGHLFPAARPGSIHIPHRAAADVQALERLRQGFNVLKREAELALKLRRLQRREDRRHVPPHIGSAEKLLCHRKIPFCRV